MCRHYVALKTTRCSTASRLTAKQLDPPDRQQKHVSKIGCEEDQPADRRIWPSASFQIRLTRVVRRTLKREEDVEELLHAVGRCVVVVLELDGFDLL